ncbi:hypothetical protein BGZ65_006474, partial [Modicella reniformis]
IESQSRKLAAKAAKPIDSTDNKAHFFLARGGIDANAINTTLNTINLRSTFEPFQPIHDTDTEAFLRHQHEQIIISTIDESRRETVMDFDSNFETSLNYDWERTKKRIFEELGHSQGGHATGSADRDMGQSSSTSGFREAYVPGFNQSLVSLDAIFSKLKPYYKIVYDLCDSRLQGTAYPLATSFVEASRLAHRDQPNPKIQETWELLVSVLGEQELRSGRFQSKTLKERVFASAQFMHHIEASVASNPAEANLGGVPSLINTIRAFVQLKYLRYGSWSQPNLEISNGQALWAQIYYLLRTGHGQEAVLLAGENEANFAPADRQFITYLATYLESEDHALPATTQERLLSDFNQRIRYSSDTVDPYKLTLYKIVGRCELAKRSTPVIGALEDFIWLQLSMIRETTNDTMPQDKYDLADFQALVLKYGPNYFNPNSNNPLQYFQVLVYSQQFERTVHMAIALTYYGLLRIPAVHRVSDPNPFSTSKDAQGNEVSHYNFNQLVHYQARLIAEHYPAEALTYLYQICLNTDLTPSINQEQISICHGYIQELVLQAKDYLNLLGTTKHGIKTPGVIEKYLGLIKVENKDHFVKSITIAAAKSKSQEGRMEDAIQLYSIAEAYNQVLELLNRQLAEVISNPGLQGTGTGTGGGDSVGGGGNGINTSAIRRLINDYVSNPKVSQQIAPRNLDTCGTLLKLVEFSELYDRAKYEAAISVIEDLGLIPLEGDMAQISKKADQFQGLDECVARNFPDVLLKTMESLYKLYQNFKMSPYDEAGRRDQMTMLKRRARTLMMFAGSIKFRMPADTYAKLNRLDVMIMA